MPSASHYDQKKEQQIKSAEIGAGYTAVTLSVETAFE